MLVFLGGRVGDARADLDSLLISLVEVPVWVC